MSRMLMDLKPQVGEIWELDSGTRTIRVRVARVSGGVVAASPVLANGEVLRGTGVKLHVAVFERLGRLWIPGR